MNFKKIIALVIAVVMLCSCFVSCDSKNSKVVMSVSGHDVPYHVYRYIVMNSRGDIEKTYGADVWTSDKADEAKAELEANIKTSLANLYTVCVLAEDFSLSWDSTGIVSEAKVQMNSVIGEYPSKSDFKKELESMNMIEDTFEFLLCNDILNLEVYDKIIYSDKNNTDNTYLGELFRGEDFIRVKQILVGGENGLSDEANLKKAKELKKKLDDGADFDQLCQEYNNDLYMFNNEDGYYIMRGTRSFEFEEAAFALEIGEISDIVLTEAGYSIIKRYEKEESYIIDNFYDLADEYYESIYTALYEEKYEAVYDSITALPEDYDIVTLK